MKRYASFLAALAMALCLCACGATSPKSVLCGEKWINVNDGDYYLFNSDGTGIHDATNTTYTVDGDNVTIVEGVSSVMGKSFKLDQSTSVKKLIPEGVNTYYVQESMYEEIGAKVREENIAILLETQEFQNAIGSTFNYLAFLEDGKGWFVTRQTGTCSMSWEVLDNNTIKCKVTISGSTNVIDLDIVANNGSPQLVNDRGEVAYIPYTK